ncbi:MAG TPA: hypothetical protein VHE58_10870 [Burkholderiales bacterium]|nr:hypothetical protein [Burkholderiales bacterium]
MHPPSRRYISRLNGPSARGWWVRVPTIEGTVASKLFSDSRFGGAGAALQAARAWRDRAWRRHFPGRRPQPRYVKRNPQRNNQTGVLGVYEQIRLVRYRGIRAKSIYRRRSIVASWIRPDGRIGRKSYSVNKYGRARALRLAAALRKRMIQGR